MWAWRRQTASDTVLAITALLEMTTAKQTAADDDAKDRFWWVLPSTVMFFGNFKNLDNSFKGANSWQAF